MKEYELVTYDKLEERGINAVKFTKNSDLDYSLDFTYIPLEEEKE